MAFESLRGTAASSAMLEAYPKLPPAARLGMIKMFGRRGDPRFIPTIAAELDSADPSIRLATLDALADTGRVEALPGLVKVAESGNNGEKTHALEAAFRLTQSMVASGEAGQAGKAFLGLYNLAKDDALRLKALDGLALHPVAEAYDVVVAALDDAALGDAAFRVLPSLFGPLAAAGRQDEALSVFQQVAAKDPSPARLVAMAGQLQGVETDLDTMRLLGVVKSWHVIGPFKWEDDSDWTEPFVGEPDIDLDATYAHGNQYLKWRKCVTSDATGTVDLMGIVGQVERSFAYAYTEIDVPEAVEAQVRVGSDDGNVIWLNGMKIWENRVDRGSAMDQDIVDRRLNAGRNAILVKVSQGGGGWNFRLRLTTPQGLGLQFTPVL
jgi:hypothetical protein